MKNLVKFEFSIYTSGFDVMFSRNGSNTDRPTVFEPATYRIIYRNSPGGAAELRTRAKSAIVDCLLAIIFFHMRARQKLR